MGVVREKHLVQNLCCPITNSIHFNLVRWVFPCSIPVTERNVIINIFISETIFYCSKVFVEMHSATIYLLIDAQSSNTNTTKICSFLTFTSIKQEIMVQLHFIIHIPSPPPISVLPWFSSFTCSRWESLKIRATCFNGLDALPATSSIRALTESQCTDPNQGKLLTGLILMSEYCGKRCCFLCSSSEMPVHHFEYPIFRKWPRNWLYYFKLNYFIC